MHRLLAGPAVLVLVLIATDPAAAQSALPGPDPVSRPDSVRMPAPVGGGARDLAPAARLPTLTPLSATRSTATLLVSVAGLDGARGSVRIAVFDDPAGFTDRPAVAAVLPATGAEVTWALPVPYGTYAVAVVHDADGDGELDTNFLGMPRERYGFSNDARGTFGPPSFGDASVDVAAPTVPVAVRVR